MTNAAGRRRAFYEASRPLSEAMALHPGDTFPLKSGSRDGVTYQMVVTPEGRVVHLDEGCEAEAFRGPGSCHHSKDSERAVSMTNAVTRYEAPVSPVAIAFDDEQMSVIKSTIAKGASDTELQLFVATCKRTGLDPFLKQIYAVKRYDSREKREVMAIQVGIDGLRLIADRTGKYAGQDPIEWLDVDGNWTEVWTGKGQHPIAARAAVYRKDFTVKVPAVCRWDSYAQYFGQDRKLSPTWAAMPDVMLGKCAEALALRRAFPAEMSGIAGAIDSDYDASADAHELQQADPANYIEGEVTHGEPAVTGAASEQRISRPAPPTPPTISEKLRQKLEGRARDIRTKHGGGVMDQALISARKEYAYATGDDGHLSLLLLKPDDGTELLAFLDRIYDGGVAAASTEPEATQEVSDSQAAPVAPAEPASDSAPAASAHTHDPVYTPHGVLVCSGCGEKLPEPEGAPA